MELIGFTAMLDRAEIRYWNEAQDDGSINVTIGTNGPHNIGYVGFEARFHFVNGLLESTGVWE